jgi:hypothetical protein
MSAQNERVELCTITPRKLQGNLRYVTVIVRRRCGVHQAAPWCLGHVLDDLKTRRAGSVALVCGACK